MPITPTQRKRAEAFITARYPRCKYAIDDETGALYVAHDPDLPGMLHVGTVEELDALFDEVLLADGSRLTPFNTFVNMAGDDVRDYVLRHVPDAAFAFLVGDDAIMVVTADRDGIPFGTIGELRRNARDCKPSKRAVRREQREKREAEVAARRQQAHKEASDAMAEVAARLAVLSGAKHPHLRDEEIPDPEIVIGVKPAPLEYILTDAWAEKQRKLLRFYNGAEDMARGLQLAVSTLQTITTADNVRAQFAVKALTDLCKSLGIPL